MANQLKADTELSLTRGAPPQKLTWLRIVHFIYFLIPRLLFIGPLRLLWHHVLFRSFSSHVQEIGRTPLANFVTNLAQYILSRADAPQTRILFDRVKSYDRIWSQSPYIKKDRAWLSYVRCNGTAGRWIAKPGTDRSKDEVVIYFIHGGGFVVDTGSNSQEILTNVAKEFNLKRNIQCSVFSLDYRLAPEYKYPSQLIEAVAGYQYLVNTLGIDESKILLAGDSAGGNLCAAFLLHLARPAKEIKTPQELGKLPGRPGGALLISPFVNLVSRAKSYSTNNKYDFIGPSSCFRVACDYIGVPPPPAREISYLSFNPFALFTQPSFSFPKGILEGEFTENEQDWRAWKGTDLFKNPYVNPSIVQDDAWWKEACPPSGNTAVCWGGKEIFADDDEALFHLLGRAGVNPTKIFAEFRAHDWILHDWNVPTSYKTKAKGPDRDFYYGYNSICKMLENLVKASSSKSTKEVQSSSGKKHTASSESAKQGQVESAPTKGESYRDAAAHSPTESEHSAVVNEGEGQVNHLTKSLGESGVLVEKSD
ncbi:uncharacterized protein JCM15063_004801 [Sporobolomyces koalae]|uniref:uncharacterized protein n=1 Tax=Sporobolomyces koalae TaxID=500713 RepID=UPI003172E2A1